MNVIVSLNMMEHANLMNLPHASESAEALYRLMYSSRVGEFFYPPYTPEVLERYIPEGNYYYENRPDKENARLIWDKIERNAMGYNDAAQAFGNNQLDAFWLFTALASAILMKRQDYWIFLTSRQRKQAGKRYSGSRDSLKSMVLLAMQERKARSWLKKQRIR